MKPTHPKGKDINQVRSHLFGRKRRGIGPTEINCHAISSVLHVGLGQAVFGYRRHRSWKD